MPVDTTIISINTVHTYVQYAYDANLLINIRKKLLAEKLSILNSL